MKFDIKWIINAINNMLNKKIKGPCRITNKCQHFQGQDPICFVH